MCAPTIRRSEPGRSERTSALTWPRPQGLTGRSGTWWVIQKGTDAWAVRKRKRKKVAGAPEVPESAASVPFTNVAPACFDVVRMDTYENEVSGIGGDVNGLNRSPRNRPPPRFCLGLSILLRLLCRCRSLRCVLSPVLFLLLLRLMVASPTYPLSAVVAVLCRQHAWGRVHRVFVAFWLVSRRLLADDRHLHLCLSVCRNSKSSLMDGPAIFLTLVSFLLSCLYVGFCLMTIFALIMANPS